MHRQFIALILASAIAVTGLSAVPAHADNHNFGKVLAGLTALALIGIVIDRNKNDAPPVVSQNYPKQNKPLRPRPLPRQVSRFDLPAQCLRNHEKHGGPKRLLGQRCLRNQYQFSQSLPEDCWVRFQNHQVTRAGYKPRCLRKKGYRIVRN